MIKLTRSDPAKNMHRFYALQLAPSLFGEWILVAEWGRIGSPGTVQEKVFPSVDLAKTETWQSANPSRPSAAIGNRPQS
jgi:predicted DNA-binding WGR domain protein